MGPLGPLGDPQQFAEALRQFADLMSYQGGPVNWDLAKNTARQTIVAKGDPSILRPRARRGGRGRPAGRPLAGGRDLAAERHPLDPGVEPVRVGGSHDAGLEDALRARSPSGRSTRWAACSRSATRTCDDLPPEMRSGDGRADAARSAARSAQRPRRDDAPDRRHDGRRPGRVPPWARSPRRSSAPATSGCRSAPRARPRCCPAGVAAFGAGPVGRRGRGQALRGHAGGGPPSAVQPCSLAASPAARRRRGLRAVASRWTPTRCGTSWSRSIRPASIRPTRKRSTRRWPVRPLFHPEDTDEQKAALARLETLLALVEGWVATVVPTRRPQPAARRPTRSPRRSGGAGRPAVPAERTFATLVGLELRPRRLREARRDLARR